MLEDFEQRLLRWFTHLCVPRGQVCCHEFSSKFLFSQCSRWKDIFVKISRNRIPVKRAGKENCLANGNGPTAYKNRWTLVIRNTMKMCSKPLNE